MSQKTTIKYPEADHYKVERHSSYGKYAMTITGVEIEETEKGVSLRATNLKGTSELGFSIPDSMLDAVITALRVAQARSTLRQSNGV